MHASPSAASDSPPVLAPLVSRLRDAGHRQRHSARLQGAALAASAALAALCVVVLLGADAGKPLTIVLALMVGAIAYVLAQPRGAASLSGLARGADLRFSSSERIITAIEVASTGRDDPMARALYADAADRGSRVEPGAMVAGPRPVTLLLPIALALVAVVLTGRDIVAPPPPTALPQAAPVAKAGPYPAAPLAAEEQASVAEDIRRAAQLIAADADRRSDPYLAAVARELMSLSEGVAEGRQSDRAAVRAELERLVRHAEDGYRRSGEVPAEVEAIAGAIGEAMETLRSEGPPPGQAGMAGEAGAPTGYPSQAGQPGPAENRDAGAGAGAVATARQGGMGQLGAEGGETKLQKDGDCIHDGDLECFLVAERTEIESVTLERVGTQQAGGQPSSREAGALRDGFLLGASSQSGTGESFEAGKGGAGFAGERVAEAAQFAGVEEIALAGERLEAAGNRLRMDMAPEAGAASLPEGQRNGAATWQFHAEAAVDRTRLDPTQGAAVARYFRPAAETPRQ